MTRKANGRIYQRERSPFFWVAFYVRGKQQREVARHVRTGEKLEATEQNVAAANKYLDSRIKDAGAQDRSGRAFVTVSVARIKVNELLNDLVTEYKRGPKSNRIPREASPQMLSHLKRLRGYFGMSNAVDVTKREIDSFVASLKSEGKKERND